MTSIDLPCSFSLTSSAEDERFLSNQHAFESELERRRTGNSSLVADIHYSSMGRKMEEEACSLAAHGLATLNTDREIARYIKESFDRDYGKAWLCICGRHFGSFVTFEPESFIYFRIGVMAFMLFRAVEL